MIFLFTYILYLHLSQNFELMPFQFPNTKQGAEEL